jgi:hypothetical protein
MFNVMLSSGTILMVELILLIQMIETNDMQTETQK